MKLRSGIQLKSQVAVQLLKNVSMTFPTEAVLALPVMVGLIVGRGIVEAISRSRSIVTNV